MKRQIINRSICIVLSSGVIADELCLLTTVLIDSLFCFYSENRELERELLETQTLNTNVGNEIEKDEMLRKVWSNGSQKFLANRRRQEIRNKRFFVGLDSTTDLTNRRAPGPKSAQATTSRPRTSVSIASPTFIKRPFTAIEPHMRRAAGDRDATDDDVFIDDDDLSVSRDTIDAKHGDISTKSSSCLLSVPKPTAYTPASTKEASPKLCVAPATNDQPKTLVVPASTTPACPLALHSDEKKSTLLDIHKKQLDSVNYSAKIKQFGERISSMCTPTSQQLSDYYTLRLQSESQAQTVNKVVSFPHLTTGGVPQDEFRRWSGNTSLKAITVKSLDLDFQRTPSSYYHECLY